MFGVMGELVVCGDQVRHIRHVTRLPLVAPHDETGTASCCARGERHVSHSDRRSPRIHRTAGLSLQARRAGPQPSSDLRHLGKAAGCLRSLALQVLMATNDRIYSHSTGVRVKGELPFSERRPPSLGPRAMDSTYLCLQRYNSERNGCRGTIVCKDHGL
jgi:hypothetical protein